MSQPVDPKPSSSETQDDDLDTARGIQIGTGTARMMAFLKERGIPLEESLKWLVMGLGRDEETAEAWINSCIRVKVRTPAEVQSEAPGGIGGSTGSARMLESLGTRNIAFDNKLLTLIVAPHNAPLLDQWLALSARARTPSEVKSQAPGGIRGSAGRG